MATVNFKDLEHLCEIIEALEKIGAQIDYSGKIDYEHNYEITSKIYEHLLDSVEKPNMIYVRKVFEDLCKKSKASLNRWNVFTDLIYYMLQNVYSLDEDSTTYILQTMYKKGFTTKGFYNDDKTKWIELYKLTGINRLLEDDYAFILTDFYKDKEFMNVIREKYDHETFCSLIVDPEIIKAYDSIPVRED